MEVAWTSMCHAGAPQFLWPQAVRYAVHQSVVWGCRANVRAPSTNKLSSRTRACIFLGFPLDTAGWVFYDPLTYEFFSSQDPTAPSRPALSGVSHVTPQLSLPQCPDPVVSGGAGGEVAEGEGTGAAGAGGVGSGGAGGAGVEFPPRSSLRPVAAEPGGVPLGGTGGPGGVGGGGAGSGGAGAGGTGTVQRVQLQLQQERAEEEPQEQQLGQVPSQQTQEEAERMRLRLRDLPDPAPARLLGFLAAAVSHLCAMLLAPEGNPDANDIPIPRTHAEAVSGPWASYWISAEEAEMASYRSTGTYVDAVPPPGTNVVTGMWLYKVKRLPGAPPVFKARYVARGFSQREGVDFFQTFAPTPKMTTLRVLLHIAAQRGYKLHSLDFSTAFLQGSLHEQIWVRRPPGFTGSFPPGTQRQLR
ncbi:unnamed protein product [Closterium sp. NIES-54]